MASGVSTVSESNNLESGDYIGENGMLMCGKCRTPKQCVVNFFGHDTVVSCICACKEKELADTEAERKKAKEMEYIEQLKKNSLMDARFESCTFDRTIVNGESRRQFDICKRYAENFDKLFEKNQGLLLLGDIGTGKTHLACCIGNYLISRMVSVFATSISRIIQQTNGYSRGAEEEYLRRMNSAKLLILDDLGAERSTDYALEIVYNVIDSRYRSKKPMIVTTNISMAELKGIADMRYNRIYDRILEVCYPVEFYGKSRRKQEAASRYEEMPSLLGEGGLA